MVIKRIGPLSAAKVTGTLYALLGLLFGGIFSLFALAGAAMSNSSGAGFGAIMGVGAILFLPILYGGCGFVFTLLGAWLYNAVAGLVGGVEMDLQ